MHAFVDSGGGPKGLPFVRSGACNSPVSDDSYREPERGEQPSSRDRSGVRPLLGADVRLYSTRPTASWPYVSTTAVPVRPGCRCSSPTARFLYHHARLRLSHCFGLYRSIPGVPRDTPCLSSALPVREIGLCYRQPRRLPTTRRGKVMDRRVDSSPVRASKACPHSSRLVWCTKTTIWSSQRSALVFSDCPGCCPVHTL